MTEATSTTTTTSDNTLSVSLTRKSENQSTQSQLQICMPHQVHASLSQKPQQKNLQFPQEPLYRRQHKKDQRGALKPPMF